MTWIRSPLLKHLPPQQLSEAEVLIVQASNELVKAKLAELGIADSDSFQIENSATSSYVPAMVEVLYDRLQRRGFLERDVRRMVNQDRNVFSALLVKLGVSLLAILALAGVAAGLYAMIAATILFALLAFYFIMRYESIKSQASRTRTAQ